MTKYEKLTAYCDLARDHDHSPQLDANNGRMHMRELNTVCGVRCGCKSSLMLANKNATYSQIRNELNNFIVVSRASAIITQRK